MTELPPLTASYCVGWDHPSLPGHFPGQPVVPGVLLVDYVLRTLQDCHPVPLCLSALPQVKFLRPVLPDMPFLVTLTPGKSEDSFRFTVIAEGEPVVSGRLTVQFL